MYIIIIRIIIRIRRIIILIIIIIVLINHCHHKHYRPERNLSELFPAILDRIITGKYSKRINLTISRAHCRKHLAVHRFDETLTEILWTKSCDELPDENSPIINSLICDRNITGENSQRILLAMIPVTIVGIIIIITKIMTNTSICLYLQNQTSHHIYIWADKGPENGWNHSDKEPAKSW